MKAKFFYLLIVLVVFGGVAWIYWNKESKERASVLPTSLPASTPIPWSPVKPEDGFGKLVGRTPHPVEKFEDPMFAAGPFREWRDIQNSKDRYLFLGSSIFSPAQEYASYPKIRVSFETSQFFNDQTGTSFAVIKNGEEESLGYFRDFTLEEINRVIKPGDYIKVIFKKTEDKKNNLVDENGNFLADTVFIPREEGKTGVERELGRKI